jgi:ADP-ribose pyrophosphatase
MEAEIKLSNGNIVTWVYIQEVDYVVAVPVSPDGKVYMKREYRVSRDEVVQELPSGKIELGGSDDVLLAEVNRELQEEVGMKAGKLDKLISFYPWNHASFKIHIFLARDLIPCRQIPDENEIIEIVTLPFHGALENALKGGSNAQTLLGLMLARDFLDQERNK